MNVYFEKFFGVCIYMEDMKVFCKEYGYVEIVFGWCIYYLGIKF